RHHSTAPCKSNFQELRFLHQRNVMIAPRLTHLSRTIVSQQSFRLTKTWAAPRTRNHCKASESDGSAPAQRSTTKQSGKWRGWIPRGAPSRYGLGRLLAFRGWVEEVAFHCSRMLQRANQT